MIVVFYALVVAALATEVRWFEQPLDHFNIQDGRTFLMRYIQDDTFFRPGGPLLLTISGENEINEATIPIGPSYDLAKELSGKIILLEHRYYGNSSPFENLTTENLVYLSVEQALEDLATFVDATKTKTKIEKVAVFGCSYAGSLATWFRYKYPHLVDAAWASSAPLRAVIDFYEYMEVAAEVYSNVSQECYNTIEDGYDEMKKVLATPEGSRLVREQLEYWSCGNVSEMDASAILTNVRYVIADHNIQPDHGFTSCKILENCDGSALEALLQLVKINSPNVCTEDESLNPNDDLAWSYQICTEFGFITTTTSQKQPFHEPSTIDEDLKTCLEFGPAFTPSLLQKGIDRINRNYASQHIKVTRVLSVHGAQDSWHKLGLYKQESEESPVIMIPGTSHCADQLQPDYEPMQLTEAKEKGRKILSRWLQT